LPITLVVFGGVILLFGLLGLGSESDLSSAIYALSALAAGLYALPATVAAVAGLLVVVWERTIRY
jgi:hypothetical protein